MAISRILAASLLFAMGCTNTIPRTEVILVGSSDLMVPAELDTLVIHVTGPGGQLQTANAMLGAGQPALPRTLGLVHDAGTYGPFQVDVLGLVRGGGVVERHARFDMLRNQTVGLRLDLSRACEHMTCGIDQTCASGACRSISVMPSELTPWTATDGTTTMMLTTDDGGA